MARSLTREQRARRYLQASMSAGYTGLPAEQREAYEAQMRSHERAYPRVREHALAGADTDFDKPLRAGEREHQRELRDREGLQHAEVLSSRRDLRSGRTRAPRAAPRRRGSSGTTAGPRLARAAAGSAGGAIAAASGSGGNTVLYLVGVMLGLSLIYLLVAGKGAGAITGIVNTLVGGVKTFVAPVDPIAAAELALGATPIASSASGSSSGSAPSTPATGVAGGVSAPGATAGVASSAPSGPKAPTPAKASALTPASLTRAIKAHRLTPAQVRADLKILYPAYSHN